MKRSKLITSLAALALLTLAASFTSVRAETVSANLILSPLNEVPAITNLNASGAFRVTLDITRDASGNITASKFTVIGAVNFPGAINITGFHIHEGVITATGPVRWDSGLTGGSPLAVATGVGIVSQRELVANATVTADTLTRFINNPAGFYLNLHTSNNPGGAIRAQFSKMIETQAVTVAMTPAQEVPPIAGLNATGIGTITLNPTRNAQGQVNGGSVTFNVAYDFPGATTFTGLHIHEGAAGVAAGVVIDTRTTAGAPIVSSTGKGFVNITVPLTTAAQIGALGRLVANPAGFYVNLHTSVNGGGAVRGQLAALTSEPAAIGLSDKYVVTAGASSATINLLVSGLNDIIAILSAKVLVNGQEAVAVPDANTGLVAVTLPASAIANPGVVQVQVKQFNGTTSKPLFIVVAPAGTPTAVATVDAAAFGASAAPESLVAAFGTNLSTQIAIAGTTLPLPTALDGTSVYINGQPASLFFVSPGQVNYQIPEGILPGPASVAVINRNGVVSQGQVLVQATAPGIFTRLSNGKGAPAAVASTDNGSSFTVVMSNADGTPVEISAGNVVALFGTGLRFRSGDITATAGGVTATPSFAGPQGGTGLDQINLTIPAGMAGKGEMDLVFSFDGKTTNAVRIKVK